VESFDARRVTSAGSPPTIEWEQSEDRCLRQLEQMHHNDNGAATEAIDSPALSDAVSTFVTVSRHLFGIAYRRLGSAGRG